MEFRLPEHFLMGVSTAATQIEGGALDGNWNDWYRQGKIADGTDPATGNDHWLKWQEDTALVCGRNAEGENMFCCSVVCE